MLVPSGAEALVVCRYNGMNASAGEPQFALRGAGATSDRAEVARLVHELDAIPATHGSYNCPYSDLSLDVATFSYRSGPSVAVTVDTGGCNELTNDHVQRLGLGRPVVRQITELARPVSGLNWPTVVGRLRVCGGPFPGRCRTQNYDRGDRVVVHRSGGPWLAMAQIRRGRFRLQIAASGSLKFDFYAGNRLVKERNVRVSPAGTTHVAFLIPVP